MTTWRKNIIMKRKKTITEIKKISTEHKEIATERKKTSTERKKTITKHKKTSTKRKKVSKEHFKGKLKATYKKLKILLVWMRRNTFRLLTKTQYFMPKKELTRLYSMSDADLKQQADDIKALVTRDIIDFNTRGVTTSTLDDFQDLIEIFDELETDEEMAGEVMDATKNKDDLATLVRKSVRPIRNMADLGYSSTGKFNSFGFADMANMTDNELCRLAKRVVRVGTKLLADLTSQGLTQETLDGLTALNTSFDQSIDAQHKAVEDRDLAKEERVTRGNNLYAQMARLCSIGKSIYEDTDEAKYNDYVITESAPATAAVATPTA